MRTRTTTAAALALLLAPGASVQSALCYYPDGTIDYDFYPCDSTANPSLGQHSACCHSNDACFSDGTCLTNDNNIPYRGACTDIGWKTDQCPDSLCMDPGLRGKEGWMMKCDLYSNSVCCFGGNGTCCGVDPEFEWLSGGIVAVLDSRGENRIASGLTTAPNSNTTAPSNTSSSSAEAQSDSSSCPPGTGTAGADSSSTGQQSAAVAGLAVALAVATIAGAGAAAYLLRKLRQERVWRDLASDAAAAHHYPAFAFNPAMAAAAMEASAMDAKLGGGGPGSASPPDSIYAAPLPAHLAHPQAELPVVASPVELSDKKR